LIALDEAFFTVVKTPLYKPGATCSGTTVPSTQTPDVSSPSGHLNVPVPGPTFDAVAPRAPKFTIGREWSGEDRTLTPETLPCLPLQTMPFNEGSTSGTIAWARGPSWDHLRTGKARDYHDYWEKYQENDKEEGEL
jgi:hypothetical protein